MTDYRKLGTTIPLLSRYHLQIDQIATIQTGDRFVRLEYQGEVRGFQSFFSTINGLLSNPQVNADVSLKLSLDFPETISPESSELSAIKQALHRNPVSRVNLNLKVKY